MSLRFKRGQEKHRQPLHEYDEIASAEREWVCASCEKFIEENAGPTYCRYCGQYWDEVRNGLFSDDWED